MNRQEGWSYANKTGHINEEYLIESLSNPPIELFNIINDDEIIIDINGGKNQKPVQTILGHNAQPKNDITIITNINNYNISLKKSNKGQAYLISTDFFLKGLNIIFNINIPQNIKDTLELFTGENQEAITSILKNKTIQELNNKLSLSQRSNRLNIQAINHHNPNNLNDLIDFFNTYINHITDFIFKRGLSSDQKFFAQFLYYKNFVDPSLSKNKIFNINELISLSSNKKIEIGKTYGGTSFQLPFGHLQMHQEKLQFHHNYDKINSLFNII
jgi:hypothetical protein